MKFASTILIGLTVITLFSGNSSFCKDLKILSVSWAYKPLQREVNGKKIGDYIPQNVIGSIKQKVHFLQKSESDKAVVATVWLRKDGRAVLNPTTETKYVSVDYNDIPPLKDLTVKTCEELWGPPVSKDEDTNVYKLVEVKNNKISNSFLIKASFASAHLRKYQILVDQEKPTGWTTVSSKPNELFSFTDSN